jgi:hypothetical protein
MLRAKSREYLSRTPCLLPILVLVLKSRFARNPHMVIFGCQNGSNGFFFRNLHEKLGKKMLKLENFFLVIWGSYMGSKVDPYENRPFHQKWSKIVNFEYFSSGKGPK